MKLIFKKIIKKRVSAFTLLETLAATAIISMVILGPLTLAVNSTSSIRQTKDVMVATYLAEESLELLHHQYDSLYIACTKGVSPCTEVEYPVVGEITTYERAWKLFKMRLSGLDSSSDGATLLDPPVASCFDSNGCTYDFMNMSTTIEVAPKTYSGVDSDTKCHTISVVNSSNSKRYVCSGVVANQGDLGGDHFLSLDNTSYSRKVFIESVPTFDEGVAPISETPNLDLYNDDLRITSKVSFRLSNGMSRTVSVVDFLHSKQ